MVAVAMNSQTKIVMIAFAAGLVPAVLAVMASGGMMPDNLLATDTQISEWSGDKATELCFPPLIFALIAVAATGYKAGLRSSVLNALGAVAGAIVIVAVTGYIAYTAETTQLPFAESGKVRDAFVKRATSNCTRKQRADPQNAALPAATIEAYCSCLGNALADVTTRFEIASLNQHKTPEPGYVEKTNAASLKCSQVVQDQK
jgi:hypothetical protein